MKEERSDREIACEVRSYLASEHMWPGLAAVDVYVEDGFATIDFEDDGLDPVSDTDVLERVQFLNQLLLAIEGLRMLACRFQPGPGATRGVAV
jgi:hypothetical protein